MEPEIASELTPTQRTSNSLFTLRILYLTPIFIGIHSSYNSFDFDSRVQERLTLNQKLSKRSDRKCAVQESKTAEQSSQSVQHNKVLFV
jgi:hypothetical protein